MFGVNLANSANPQTMHYTELKKTQLMETERHSVDMMS